MPVERGPAAQTEPGHDAAWRTSAFSAPEPGSIIAERYRIQSVLGQGGMGVVFAAEHVHTGRPVALKLIHCKWGEETEVLYQRFVGEARNAASVRHPNVVDVLDMGHHQGAPYLVMERLVGESLEQLLERQVAVPLATAVEWLLPVLGALALLHEKGVVHRDIKPSNIFLARDPALRVTPKLLDFGLARGTDQAQLTEPGMMLGTPQYMAPERLCGEPSGPASDVWAMGVVLFECVCGRLPFAPGNLSDIASQLLAGKLIPARVANPELPGPVAEVLDRALRPSPAERIARASDLADALTHALRKARATLPRAGVETLGQRPFDPPDALTANLTIPLVLTSRPEARVVRRTASWKLLSLGLFALLVAAMGWRTLLQREIAALPPAPPSLNPAPLPLSKPEAQLRQALVSPPPTPLDVRPEPPAPASAPEPEPPPATRKPRAGHAKGRAQRRESTPKAPDAIPRQAAPERPEATDEEFEREWL